MKTVVCQLALGRTRVSGYTLYDHERMAFEETTPRDTKHLIKDGLVNGLCLDKDGEIQLDEKGYNCKNLLIKSGVGNYRPMFAGDSLAKNGMFALTKVACTDDGLVYEVVSNECARLPITEQKLRALYQVGCLCGCWISDETDMIEFARGVEMIDMTSEAVKMRQMAEQQETNMEQKSETVEEAPVVGEEIPEVSEPEPTPEVEQPIEQSEEQPGPEKALGFDELPTMTEDVPTELAEGEQSLEEMLGIPVEVEHHVEEKPPVEEKKAPKSGAKKNAKKRK